MWEKIAKRLFLSGYFYWLYFLYTTDEMLWLNEFTEVMHANTWLHIEESLNIYTTCIILKKIIVIIEYITAESSALMVDCKLHINHVVLRIELTL